MRRSVALLVAASLLAATACGTVAERPTPTPAATTPAPSATASATPTATPVPHLDHDVVYFARDRLPPVAAHVDAAGTGATVDERILSRLRALFAADAPPGLFNVTRGVLARPRAARVDGDLVTVDFDVPGGDWGTAGSAGTRAFIQQIVYTAAEEPGVRRVLITENGHEAIVGGEGVVIDHPSTRDAVAGYTVRASTDPVELRAEPRASVMTVESRVSVDAYAPALARFVVDTGLRGEDAKASLAFAARVAANDERARPELGKWVLSIDVADARTGDEALRLVERTPVRSIRSSAAERSLRYEIGLDDLRPWRVAMLYEPLRLVVDIGGDPDGTSANIALYRPAFGTSLAVGEEVSGLVRAFEARYEYRVRDSRGSLVVDEFATASLGTSELWGAFAFPMPAVPAGAVTLEILLRSPRDGSVAESVFTSLAVR